MATTRIMPLHTGKGRTESQAVSDTGRGVCKAVHQGQSRLCGLHPYRQVPYP